MKKIIALFLVLSILTGCSKREEPKQKETKKETTEVKEQVPIEPKYVDQNNTPIGLYSNGNKIQTFNAKLTPLEDINIFQIYPSKESSVPSNTPFGQAFYNEYQKYVSTNPNLKIGFNFKYTIDTGEQISYNILNPYQTNEKYSEYILSYLYDDYVNLGKGFYSHLEQSDYNESTLFTSIKLQAGGYSYKIKSNIELTVFTYDTEDDFENNEYRGNSKDTITIQIQ
ncbi:MAG: hypothetical protein IJ193_03035 [Bacilli bacterium]|nr:hypothetical protein [Bacilli bacterium]